VTRASVIVHRRRPSPRQRCPKRALRRPASTPCSRC
jgi:hypothetical protein